MGLSWRVGVPPTVPRTKEIFKSNPPLGEENLTACSFSFKQRPSDRYEEEQEEKAAHACWPGIRFRRRAHSAAARTEARRSQDLLSFV
jgi:hypothetical protein